MTAGTVFLIVRDVIQVFVDVGVLLPSGAVVGPTAQQDAQIAAKVNAVLKAHGLVEPAQVDAVIQLLPLVFQLVGLK
jgi:hypothetical protein